MKYLPRLIGLCGRIPGEIIVINNDSTDDTESFVRQNFPSVRFFARTFNSGAEARNVGIRSGRGDYVCMLDDDSVPEEGAVREGIRLMERGRRIGCLAFRIAMPRGRFWTNGIFTTFAGCGALLSRKALLSIGGYPPGYGYYVEEYDVSFRLWAAGYRLINARGLTVFHEQADSGRDINRIINRLVANNVKLYTKFFPPRFAAERVKYEIMRYRAIAAKEGAMEGLASGLREGGLKVFDPGHRPVFSAALCRRVLGLGVIQGRLRRFVRKRKIRSAAVHTLGKSTDTVIRMLKSEGVRVTGVYDNNKEFEGISVEGVPVYRSQRLSKANRTDAVVCGSSSLSVNDEVEQHVTGDKKFGSLPFLRLCDYDV